MSSFPDTAFEITGGCSCKAIRYTIHVPPLDDRGVVLPAAESNGQGNIRMPQSAVCFCNDCRRLSGGLMLFALMAPFTWTRFSLLRLNATEGGERVEFGAEERLPPKPELNLGDSEALDGTYLQMYRSSEKAMRCFCSKCGVQALYVYTGYIPPGGTSGGLDFYLDKQCLEAMGGLDRTVNGDLAIPWVKEVLAQSERTKRHPGTSMKVLE